MIGYQQICHDFLHVSWLIINLYENKALALVMGEASGNLHYKEFNDTFYLLILSPSLLIITIIFVSTFHQIQIENQTFSTCS